MTSIVLTLVVISFLVVRVAVRMTRVADEIAETTDLARGFVGMLLLAVATSLPELASSLFAVLIYGAPGLTFGNVFGSNVTNLAFIGLLDFMIVGSIFAHAAKEHVVNALWTVILTVMSGAVIVTEWWSGGTPIGFGKLLSLCILAAYVHALYGQPRTEASPSERSPTSGLHNGSPWLRFVACAVAILVLGLLLAQSCDELACLSGLGHTFVGTLVMALVTSLPELVVSIESVRLGSIDMAFGNLIGSNLFNITILAICDLASPRSSLYAAPEAMASLPTAVMGCLMIGLVGAGLWCQQRWAIGGRVSPISLLLVLAYITSNVMTYLH